MYWMVLIFIFEAWQWNSPTIKMRLNGAIINFDVNIKWDKMPYSIINCTNGDSSLFSLCIAILLIICSRVLGMEKGSIIDAQVKASTEWDSSYAAKNARLNLAAGRGGWRPRIDNTDQWIQVDLGENTQVAGIKTQGCAKHEEWVESFTISYSNDGTIFQPYEQNKVWWPFKIIGKKKSK